MTNPTTPTDLERARELRLKFSGYLYTSGRQEDEIDAILASAIRDAREAAEVATIKRLQFHSKARCPMCPAGHINLFSIVDECRECLHKED